MLEPSGAAERAMRQAAVEAGADAERAEQIIADEHHGDAGPTEQPWHQGKQRQKVNHDHADRVRPYKAAQVGDGGNQRNALSRGVSRQELTGHRPEGPQKTVDSHCRE